MIEEEYTGPTLIAIASDHAGLEMKVKIMMYFANQSEYLFVDQGTFINRSCDYPTYARKAANMVVRGEAKYGILVCGTGNGIAIAANKVRGIRCAVGYSDEVTELARKHNDANMIAFGGRTMEVEDVIRRIEIFLHTDFEGGRHARRVEMIEK